MESNEIEFFKSLKLRVILAFSLLAILFISVSSVIAILLLPWYYIIIIEVIVIAILILIGIQVYKRNSWIRFVINDEKFMVEKPKKVKCEVYWSEFDKMKLKVLGREIGSLKPRKLQRRVNVFKIKLYHTGSNDVIKREKFAWIRKKEAREMMNLINDYAVKKGKEVILKTRDMRS